MPRCVARGRSHRESIWISYCPKAIENIRAISALPFWFASPAGLSGGAMGAAQDRRRHAPILTRHGWLVIYHGVDEAGEPTTEGRRLRYSAGVMILSEKNPHVICYRSPEPVLTPDLPQERQGAVSNVVFPTGIDRRDDLGLSDRFDVYYGMADDRIGVARLDLPEDLPIGAPADSPEQGSHRSQKQE